MPEFKLSDPLRVRSSDTCRANVDVMANVLLDDLNSEVCSAKVEAVLSEPLRFL